MSTTPRPTWRATSGSRLAKVNGSWKNILLHPIQLIQPTQRIAQPQLVQLVQLMVNLAKVQPMGQPIQLANLVQLAQLVNLVQLINQPVKAQLTGQLINLDQRQPMVQPAQLVNLVQLAQLTSQLPKVQPRLKTSKYLKAHKPRLKPKSLKLPRDCHQAKAQPRNGSPSVNQAAHTPLKTANTMDATNFPVHT